MKEYILRHIHRSLNMPEFLTAIFALLLLSVQLFIFGPEGYRNITEVKYASFLLICGAYIILMAAFWLRKQYGFLKKEGRSPAEKLICVYFALTMLSALLSEFFPDTLIGAERQEGVLTIGLYCAMFLLTARFAWSGKWAVYAFGAASAFFAVICIFQLFEVNILGLFPPGLDYYDAGKKYSGEFLGTLGNAGFTAAFLGLSSAMLITYILRAREKERLLLLIPFALSFAVLLASRIAAGIVGLAVGLYAALPFIFCEGKKRAAMIAAEIIIAALALLLIYLLDFKSGLLYELHHVLHGRWEDSFGSSRIFIWRNTLPLVAEKPLLGGGPDTLAERIGVIFETVQEDGSVRKAAIDAAHNEYLNIAASQGIPALLAYLAALISTFVRSANYAKKDPVTAALMAAVLSYGIQAFFGISMFIAAPYFWLVWALLESRIGYLKKCER